MTAELSQLLNSLRLSGKNQSQQTSPEAMPETQKRPVGFYWDLENCQLPSTKSAFSFVQKLRHKFGKYAAEVDFVCVCDVTKERRNVINDLNKAQASVIHVCATSKNAADEKLKVYLRKFGHSHKAPGTVVLISGDVNFSPELSDLRFRCGFDVVLIHGDYVSDALIATAQRSYNFRQLLDDIPGKNIFRPDRHTCLLKVQNLPQYVSLNKVRDRLLQLSDNCGGRIDSLNYPTGTAMLKFPNQESTLRAKKRMDNEDVFGSRISVRVVGRFRLPYGSGKYSSLKKPKPKYPEINKTEPQDFSSYFFRPIRTGDKLNREDCSNFEDDEEEEGGRRGFAGAESFFEDEEDTTEDEELVEIGMGNPEKEEITREAYRLLIDPKEQKKRENEALTNQLKQLLSFKPTRTFYTSTTPNSGSSTSGGSPEDMPGLAESNELQQQSPSPEDAEGDRNQLSDGLDQVPIKVKKNCGFSGSFFTSVSSAGIFGSESGFQGTSRKSESRRSHSPEPSPTNGPFELRVDNLDCSAQPRDLKRALQHAFSEVVKVTDVNILPTGDGRIYGLVRVESWEDAKAGIGHVDKQKIGAKRVYVSVDSRSPTPLESGLRKLVVDILNEQSSKAMQKAKFLQLLSASQGKEVTNLDLYHLRDVVREVESSSGTTYMRLNSKYSKETFSTNEFLNVENAAQSPIMSKIYTKPPTPTNPCPPEVVPRPGSLTRRQVDLGEKMMDVLVVQPDLNVKVKDIPAAFENVHGIGFSLSEKQATDLAEKLPGAFKVERIGDSKVVGLAENRKRSVWMQQIYYLFLKKPEAEMSVEQFEKAFFENFGSTVNTDDMKAKFPELLEWWQRASGAMVIRLTGIQRFALKSRKILMIYGSEDVPLSIFEECYERKYKEAICPQKYGYPTLMGLIRAASNVLYIKGRGANSTVCLNRNFLSVLRNSKSEVHLSQMSDSVSPLFGEEALESPSVVGRTFVRSRLPPQKDMKEVPPRFQKLAEQQKSDNWHYVAARRGGNIAKRGRGMARRAKYWGNGRYYPEPPQRAEISKVKVEKEELLGAGGFGTSEVKEFPNRSADESWELEVGSGGRSFDILPPLMDSFDSGCQCGEPAPSLFTRSLDNIPMPDFTPLGEPPSPELLLPPVLLPPKHFDTQVPQKVDSGRGSNGLGIASFATPRVENVEVGSDDSKMSTPTKRKSRLAVKFPGGQTE